MTTQWVWAATYRRGINYHAFAGGSTVATSTACGRSTHAGQWLELDEALGAAGMTPCPRCYTDEPGGGRTAPGPTSP